ncbi:hypothetical protein [Rhodospira trueperi]|uniref:Uncharacterized protein n=1 Tax=Rhodospira trueperi TaxID=69960 RepID=A0A1G7EM72_9PROT|nr:hypothetical protein [Rhodospira trueperi]SDE64788.1 hypothetical protein SAMN05421720_109130 [Rhodospira trueperi]
MDGFVKVARAVDTREGLTVTLYRRKRPAGFHVLARRTRAPGVEGRALRRFTLSTVSRLALISFRQGRSRGPAGRLAEPDGGRSAP